MGSWQKVCRDAVLDNEYLKACPTRRWKHTRPEWDPVFENKNAHVLFCIRNPYSWILALWRRPYHQRGPRKSNLMEFVSQPWITLLRDNMVPILQSPLELWNGKVAAYRQFAKEASVPTGNFRFEEFIENPEFSVREKLSELGLPFEGVRAINISTKNRSETLVSISEYYRKELWKSQLTHQLVAAVNSQVNWELAEYYGYNQLNPEGFRKEQEITSRNLFRNHSSKLRSGYR